MRKVFTVLALILALTCFTYAGEMPNGLPEPPPPSAPAEPSTEDEMHYPLVQLALNLLALF